MLVDVARRVGKNRIMAGDDNDGVNAALVRAGYPTLSRQTLNDHYRHDPAVKAGLESHNEILRQIAYGDRERHFQALCRRAVKMAKRMGIYYGDEFDPDADPPCGWHNFTSLGEKLDDVLDKIREMVDDPAQPAGQQAGAVYMNQPRFELGQFVDQYRRMLDLIEERRRIEAERKGLPQ